MKVLSCIIPLWHSFLYHLHLCCVAMVCQWAIFKKLNHSSFSSPAESEPSWTPTHEQVITSLSMHVVAVYSNIKLNDLVHCKELHYLPPSEKNGCRADIVTPTAVFKRCCLIKREWRPMMCVISYRRRGQRCWDCLSWILSYHCSLSKLIASWI